ncbi:prepilin-type N-terminal cleavage/methylation domain-containing protein [Patescibacteria group bacterium]|nr:prepilin-type N-terminal cleavage/methylation domain-containing protein [Patescibacteria group bacterium]
MEVNNKNNGFTLVEILVVIVIIMILTLVALPYFLQAGKQFALSRSAHKLAQDIRRAQEMSMSAKEFHGIISSGGYGIRITDSYNKYILFADCNNNGLYDGEIVNPSNPYDPENPDLSGTPCNGYSEKVEVLETEKGIQIGLGPAWGLFRGRVIFTPPDPVVAVNYGICDPNTGWCFIYNFAYPSLTAMVSLETDPSKTKTISVNEAGLIEIK